MAFTARRSASETAIRQFTVGISEADLDGLRASSEEVVAGFRSLR